MAIADLKPRVLDAHGNVVSKAKVLVGRLTSPLGAGRVKNAPRAKQFKGRN